MLRQDSNSELWPKIAQNGPSPARCSPDGPKPDRAYRWPGGLKYHSGLHTSESPEWTTELHTWPGFPPALQYWPGRLPCLWHALLGHSPMSPKRNPKAAQNGPKSAPCKMGCPMVPFLVALWLIFEGELKSSVDGLKAKNTRFSIPSGLRFGGTLFLSSFCPFSSKWPIFRDFGVGFKAGQNGVKTS